MGKEKKKEENEEDEGEEEERCFLVSGGRKGRKAWLNGRLQQCSMANG